MDFLHLRSLPHAYSLRSSPVLPLLVGRRVAGRNDANQTPASGEDDEEKPARFGCAKDRKTGLAPRTVGGRANSSRICDRLLGFLGIDAVTTDVIGVVVIPIEHNASLLVVQ